MRIVRALVGLIATVAVVSLAACDGGGPPTGQAADVIPWVDTPAVTTTTTTPTLPPATAPLCRASKLSASARPGGAATGNLATDVYLTNLGPATCQLSGWATISGLRSGSPPVPLIARHGTFFGPTSPVDLKPNQKGVLVLGTTDGCDVLSQPDASASQANVTNSTYAGIMLSLPGGGELAVSGVNLDVACGLSESQLGGYPPPPVSPSPPGPGNLSSLVMRLVLPGGLQPGQAYRYEVVLTNPWGSAIRLSPCPSYTENLDNESFNNESLTYRLNCRAVREIAGHRSVTLAMRVPSPAKLLGSVAKLSWNLNTGNGPSSGAVLRIDRSPSG